MPLVHTRGTRCCCHTHPARHCQSADTIEGHVTCHTRTHTHLEVLFALLPLQRSHVHARWRTVHVRERPTISPPLHRKRRRCRFHPARLWRAVFADHVGTGGSTRRLAHTRARLDLQGVCMQVSTRRHLHHTTEKTANLPTTVRELGTHPLPTQPSMMSPTGRTPISLCVAQHAQPLHPHQAA